MLVFVAAGPLLGQLTGLGEHDGHSGPAHGQLGEAVSDHGWANPVKLEDRGVAILDNDGSTAERSKFAECIAELAVDHAGDKIGQ